MKRFRLSTLMLLVLIAGLAIALVVQHRRAAEREARLRAEIQEARYKAAITEARALLLGRRGDHLLAQRYKAAIAEASAVLEHAGATDPRSRLRPNRQPPTEGPQPSESQRKEGPRP